MDNRNIILTGFLILFSISLVSSLGLNSPYWKDNPLKMYAGETKYIQFSLENSVNEQENAKVVVSLVDSGGIAEIVGNTEFIVPPGSKDQKIILKISLPKDAEIERVYNIKFSVRPTSTSQTGNVQLNIGYDAEFPVLVTEKSEVSQDQVPGEESKLNIIFLIIPAVLIAIILILYFVYKKKQV